VVTGQEQTRTTGVEGVRELGLAGASRTGDEAWRIGDGGPGFVVSFSWVSRPTPPVTPPRPPRGRLGRAMHPNSVATLTPISGVSLPDGQRSGGLESGVWTSRGKGIFDPLPSCFRHQHHPQPSSSRDVDIERVQRHTRPLCPLADPPRRLHRVAFHRPRRSRLDDDRTCLDVDWSRHELQPRPTDSSLSIGLRARLPPTAHRLPNLRLLRGLYNRLAVGVKKGDRPSAS
jgi:hypothetical protein